MHIKQTELQRLIEERPGNVKPEEIVAALSQQGHTIEGYPEKGKSTLGKIGDFFKFAGKDLLGISKPSEKEGFARSLFAETVGSKGLAGVFQLPGKVAGSYIASGQEETIQRSRQELANDVALATQKAFSLPEDSEQRKQLLQIAKDNMALISLYQTEVKELQEKQITPGEAMATTLRGEATAFLGGLGKAETAGIAAAAGGASGAMFGLAEAAEADKPLGEGLTGTALSAALGSVLHLGAYGLGKVWNKLTKDLPKTLYQKAFKQSTEELRKEAQKKAPELAQQLLDRGVKGSENKMIQQAYTALNETERQLNSIISKQGTKKISTQVIVESLDDIIARYENVLGKSGSKAINQVKQNILKKGKEITVEAAVQLKRDIYKTLSNNAFNTNAALSQQAEALRIVANSLMKETGNQVPKIAEVSKLQQMWIRTAQALEGRLAQTNRANIIGLSDTFLAGEALSSGSPFPFLAGIGRRVLETGRTKTWSGWLLDRLGQVVEKIPTDKAGRVSKSIILKKLSEIGK